jgi:thiamine pyrophosphokinase
MLGIIFTGGNGPPPELVHLLAGGKNALLAAADSGLELAEGAGLRPHWIIGDMDSLSDPARLAAYPAEQVLRFPDDKDFTDTELAFSLLREKGCDEIWIIGGGGGRIDHFLGIRSLLEREFFPSRWYLDSADIYCFQAASENQGGKPESGKLCLRLKPGGVVSVFPLGAGPWAASSSGLKWPLDGLTWDRGFFGLSNIAQTGEIVINSLQGRFMALVPRMSP